MTVVITCDSLHTLSQCYQVWAPRNDKDLFELTSSSKSCMDTAFRTGTLREPSIPFYIVSDIRKDSCSILVAYLPSLRATLRCHCVHVPPPLGKLDRSTDSCQPADDAVNTTQRSYHSRRHWLRSSQACPVSATNDVAQVFEDTDSKHDQV